MATFYVGQTDYVEQLNILSDLVHDVVDSGVYTERIEFVTDFLIYIGEAVAGSVEGDPVWRIRRATLDGSDNVTTHWADGNVNFDNIWTDRASLSYS